MPRCVGVVAYELANGCDNQLEQVQALLGVGINVEFTVADEVAGTINVALQVVDADGNDVTTAYTLRAWLSDTAAAAVTATAPDEVAIGTDGVILEETTANAAFELLTESDGDLDLDIDEAAADTWFLNVRLPSGAVVSSDAITFAGP